MALFLLFVYAVIVLLNFRLPVKDSGVAGQTQH